MGTEQFTEYLGDDKEQQTESNPIEHVAMCSFTKVYLIITGCKDPYTAKPFTMITSDDNMVYEDYADAEAVVKIMNDVDGEGYARMIAL